MSIYFVLCDPKIPPSLLPCNPAPKHIYATLNLSCFIISSTWRDVALVIMVARTDCSCGDLNAELCGLWRRDNCVLCLSIKEWSRDTAQCSGLGAPTTHWALQPGKNYQSPPPPLTLTFCCLNRIHIWSWLVHWDVTLALSGSSDTDWHTSNINSK